MTIKERFAEQEQLSDTTPAPPKEDDTAEQIVEAIDTSNPSKEVDPSGAKPVRVSRTVRVRIISSPVTATVVSDNSKPNDEEVGTSNTNTRMHTSGTEQQQQSDTINDYQSGCCQGGTGSYIEDRCQMRPSWCCAITIAMTVLFFVGLVMMGSDNSVQTEEEWEKEDETTMSDYGPIGKTIWCFAYSLDFWACSWAIDSFASILSLFMVGGEPGEN